MNRCSTREPADSGATTAAADAVARLGTGRGQVGPACRHPGVNGLGEFGPRANGPRQ